MSRFFIDRPIFAWVLAIMISLAGVLAITRLPLTPYPTIAPPSISINANYPGAAAQTVEDSVTQVIEQNMNALDGLIYMSSSSTSSGGSITLTFASRHQRGHRPGAGAEPAAGGGAAAAADRPAAGHHGQQDHQLLLMAIGFFSEDAS